MKDYDIVKFAHILF